MDKKRLNLEHIDVLRNIAIILVVLGHAGCIYAGKWNYRVYNNQSSIIKYITEFIYSIHMPLFVFISGYIYNYNREQQNKYSCKSKFIMSKAKRLLIPYLTTGILFMIPLQTLFNVYTNEMSIIERSIKGILLAMQPAHLWYLLMLFNLFVIFRILENTINRQRYSMNLILMLILAIISNIIPNIYQIASTLRYLPYFYIGYLFSRHIEKIMRIKINNLFIFITYFTVFNIYYLINLYNNKTTMFKIMNVGTGYIIAFLGILCLFRVILKYINQFKKVKNSRVYLIINKYNFYIYLLHQPIMLVLISLIKDIDIPVFIVYSLLFIVTMIASIIISSMIERTKHIRKIDINKFIERNIKIR